MAIETKNVIHAAGTVNGADGARRSGSGYVPARTGVGVYTLTLDQPINAGECQIVTSRGSPIGVPYSISHSNTTDSLKTIVIVDGAGAPFDATFAFIITRS